MIDKEFVKIAKEVRSHLTPVQNHLSSIDDTKGLYLMRLIVT